MKLQQMYPIENNQNIVKKMVKKLKKILIKCDVCGKLTYAINNNPENIRESLKCHNCGATTRQRQIAKLICQTIGIKSLSEIDKYSGHIYNTESFGPVHNQLLKTKHYIFSEYFGENYKSGEKVNNILNEDLTKLSFKNKTFDIVVSSDVFEHISKPYKAHKEVYRILKNGGSHIFTVPFYENQYLDETRVVIQNNKIKNILKPMYHLDGIRPDEGILVYNIFSLEMLIKLKEIGFDTKIYQAQSTLFHINIHSSILFKATKQTIVKKISELQNKTSKNNT